jgi:hypothetical protein
MDCFECRDEVDMDRNENLKTMIRKYFEQEHSNVEAETEEVIIITFIWRESEIISLNLIHCSKIKEKINVQSHYSNKNCSNLYFLNVLDLENHHIK